MWIKTMPPSNKESLYRCPECGRRMNIWPMFFGRTDYEWAYVCESDLGGCGAVFDIDEVIKS